MPPIMFPMVEMVSQSCRIGRLLLLLRLLWGLQGTADILFSQTNYAIPT